MAPATTELPGDQLITLSGVLMDFLRPVGFPFRISKPLGTGLLDERNCRNRASAVDKRCSTSSLPDNPLINFIGENAH